MMNRVNHKFLITSGTRLAVNTPTQIGDEIAIDASRARL